MNHSFTVKALKEVGVGKWEADVVDGQDWPLPMAVTVIDGVVHVEYMMVSGSETIHLTLQNGTILRGEARPRGGNASVDVRLEKQDPPTILKQPKIEGSRPDESGAGVDG